MAANFKDRVLHNGMTWNILRVGRRSGKTHLVMEWILENPDEVVALITPTEMGFRLLVEQFREFHPDLVAVHSRDYLQLRNGTRIFRFPRDTRGEIKYTKIAIDEAGQVGEIYYSVVKQLAKEGMRVLAVTTSVGPASLFRKLEEAERLDDAYYEEYSYIDALEDHHFTDDLIKEIKGQMSKAGFKRDYGPWNTIKKYETNRKNKDYKHLLKK